MAEAGARTEIDWARTARRHAKGTAEGSVGDFVKSVVSNKNVLPDSTVLEIATYLHRGKLFDEALSVYELISEDKLPPDDQRRLRASRREVGKEKINFVPGEAAKMEPEAEHFGKKVDININGSNTHVANPSIKIFKHENSYVLQSTGLIADQDRKILPNYVPPALSMEPCSDYLIGEDTNRDIWLSGVFYISNYFHWMIQGMPSLEMISQEYPGATVMVPESRRKFFDEVAGFYKKDINFLYKENDSRALKFKSIRVPRVLDISHPEYLSAFTQRLLKTCDLKRAGLPKRIYISRADAPTRRPLLNRREFSEALEALGFTEVVLSGKTVFEQAVMLNEADVIVGEHGAGLANLMFCHPGATVVELVPPALGGKHFRHRSYPYLANYVSTRYYRWLSALSTEVASSASPFEMASWNMDIEAALEFISSIME